MRPLRALIASILLVALCPGVLSAKDMTFDIINMNHTNVIVGDGKITMETPRLFQEVLDSDRLDGFRFVVALNSNGGSLFGGMELGRKIRSAGFATAVHSYLPRKPGEKFWNPRQLPGTCMSACGLAFLGGEERTLDASSRIGFHQFSSVKGSITTAEQASKAESVAQIVSSDVLSYVVEMGGTLELFHQMSNVLPEGMFVPEQDELRTLNILSQVAFQDFGFEPYKQGVIAYSVFPGNVSGRSAVHQITAYCKRGVPYILLSGEPGFEGLSKEWVDNYRDYGDFGGSFTLFSRETGQEAYYHARNVRFRVGSSVIAEVEIDERGIGILIENGQARIDVSAASGYIFAFTVSPTAADVQKIRSAFTHCIS